jgi:hypothetical protein
MLRLFALLFALALASPAFAQPAPPSPPAKTQAKPAKSETTKPAAPKATAPVKQADPAPTGPCIGVISRVGDFSIQDIGLVVFANDLKEIPVPAWGLDDLVVARVRASAGPRANVRKISYSPAAFAPYERPERTLFRNSEDDLARVVKAVAQSSGCERYVVVVRGGSKFAGTNQSVSGIGVVNYAGAKTYLYALTYIRIYDGRSFAIVKRGPGGDYKLFSSLFTTGISGPSREVKGLTWPPAPDSLREQIRAMLAESMDQALPKLLAPER